MAIIIIIIIIVIIIIIIAMAIKALPCTVCALRAWKPVMQLCGEKLRKLVNQNRTWSRSSFALLWYDRL
jgi:hypothetical protein